MVFVGGPLETLRTGRNPSRRAARHDDSRLSGYDGVVAAIVQKFTLSRPLKGEGAQPCVTIRF
jgi:hypothetical protein